LISIVPQSEHNFEGHLLSDLWVSLYPTQGVALTRQTSNQYVRDHGLQYSFIYHYLNIQFSGYLTLAPEPSIKIEDSYKID
jgi:hypothetical protein